MGFTEYLQIPELAQRYRKVKQYFFLRESAYDVTSVCQLRCDGCYYFQGRNIRSRHPRSTGVESLLRSRKRARHHVCGPGGAEPALVPKILRACYEVLPLGTIVSNGLRKIDADLRYRVQLSVWGDSTGDPIYRNAGGQPGPFVCPCSSKTTRTTTGSSSSIPSIMTTSINSMRFCPWRHGEGHKLTFNVFSNPVQCTSPLKMQDTLKKTVTDDRGHGGI